MNIASVGHDEQSLVEHQRTEMARLLIIAYSTYVRDGRVKRHAEALAARGDQVDVICLHSELLRSTGGVNLIGIEMPRYRGASRSRYLRSYMRFFSCATLTATRLARLRPYDVVITCSMPDAVVLCALPLRLFGARLILDIHDTMPELYRDKFGGSRGALGARLLMLEERASAWLADRVLAVHEPHRERLELAGISADKICTVLNAPDPSIFFPTFAAKRPDRAPTLVCHGTITRRLGLEVAFRAIALLRERGLSVRLLVIGSGDYLASAQSRVADLKLDDLVRLVPPVPIEKLPAMLRQADCGLVPNAPSAATHLMLPAKLMEYAALGIPVIAARLRAIEHYFSDDALSLFEAGNPYALAEAISDFCMNPGRAAARAERALAIAHSLGWEGQRARFFQAVDSLLHHTQGPVAQVYGSSFGGYEEWNRDGKREAEGADSR